jgi:hypothetical protein
MKNSKQKLSPKELEALNIERQYKECIEHMKYHNKPTRQFSIGEEVLIGNIDKCVVMESFENGMFYKIFCIKTNENYGNPYAYEKINIWFWDEIFPKKIKATQSFTTKQDIFLQYAQQNISSIFNCYYHFGIDMNPLYQRDYVWSLEDKVNLIDSIYNDLDIGKFVLIRREYSSVNELYEVLDGKQRINALIEFYEDRFQYKGFYFSELQRMDRYQFTDLRVSVAYVEPITEEQKIKLFLALNTSGKVMDKEHIENVRKLLIKE